MGQSVIQYKPFQDKFCLTVKWDWYVATDIITSKFIVNANSNGNKVPKEKNLCKTEIAHFR